MTPQTNGLNSIANNIFRLLPIIRREIEYAVTQTLKDTKIDIAFHHLLILKRLQEEHGQLYINKIGESMGISKAQMTQSIDKLASLNLVTRQHSESDRRKILITLTDKGNKVLNQVDTTIWLKLKIKFQDKSEQELKTISTSIESIIEAFEEMGKRESNT